MTYFTAICLELATVLTRGELPRGTTRQPNAPYDAVAWKTRSQGITYGPFCTRCGVYTKPGHEQTRAHRFHE